MLSALHLATVNLRYAWKLVREFTLVLSGLLVFSKLMLKNMPLCPTNMLLFCSVLCYYILVTENLCKAYTAVLIYPSTCTTVYSLQHVLSVTRLIIMEPVLNKCNDPHSSCLGLVWDNSWYTTIIILKLHKSHPIMHHIFQAQDIACSFFFPDTCRLTNTLGQSLQHDLRTTRLVIQWTG